MEGAESISWLANNTTRVGIQCKTPVTVKPLPLPVQKASSSEALFSNFKQMNKCGFMPTADNVGAVGKIY